MKKHSFTLVELIIVIAIIAILAVSAFLVLTKWIGKSKNSRVISDIGIIKKSIQIHFTEKGKYPTPNQKTTITLGGTDIFTQGIIGDGIVKELGNISASPLDPFYNLPYTYSVSNDKKYYNISAATNQKISYYTNSALADSFYAILDGNFDNTKFSYNDNGIIRNTNFPSIVLSDITNPDINFEQENNNFVIKNGKNMPANLADKFPDGKGNYPFVPRKMSSPFAIYYGWPSSLNYPTNNRDIDKIIDDFNQYGVVIFGDGLQNSSHGDYTNFINILNGYNGISYGYIKLSKDISTITTAINNWKTTGVKGIFLDEAGYDYLEGVDSGNGIIDTKIKMRTHQNNVINLVHENGMKVIMNGRDVDDIFGTQNGEDKTQLKATDGYLFEDFVRNPRIGGNYYEYDQQISKISKYKEYNKILNIGTYCVGMLPTNNDITQSHINTLYQKSQGLCNYIQITNKNFSSDNADNGILKKFYK